MRRWTEALVVGEVALAVVLTLGAGLLVRSFRQLTRIDPGFDPHGVLVTQIALSGPKYDSASAAIAFYDELTRRVAALPGVLGAAGTLPPPLVGTGYTSDFVIAGRPAGEYYTEITHRRVTPDYFRVMRVPIRRGRAFTAADGAKSPPVVIINEQVASRYFKGQDPVGQRLTFDKIPNDSSQWATVVGIASNERQKSLSTDPLPEVYQPMAQDPASAIALMTRVSGSLDAVVPAIRRIVAGLDPDLAISNMESMDAIRSSSLARERFLMTMLVVFASVGLLLAIIGVYGVLAQFARSRTREMGIRIALGAPPSGVRWLVVRQGLRLVFTGLASGLVIALVATRGITSLLYHVAAADPITYAAVPLLLAITGLAAAWIPARQASRADPAIALRAE
jgi:putative ABC transport system permease protein